MANVIKIEARYVKDGQKGVAYAEAPYVSGKHMLPDVYPFNLNKYVGPDAGYSLRDLVVDTGARMLHFAYAQPIRLDEKGRGFWVEEYKTGERIEFSFVLAEPLGEDRR